MVPRAQQPHRVQHAAMGEIEEYEDQRGRAPVGRGVKSDRPGSPPRGPRRRSDYGARHRPSARPPFHNRRNSLDRGRAPTRPDAHPSNHRNKDKDDLIPRFRGHKSGPPSQAGPRGRGRDSPDSPASSKRYRSRSRSPSTRDRKKSRRNQSPTPRDRDNDTYSATRDRRREESPRARRQTSSFPGASPNHPDHTSFRERRGSQSRSPPARTGNEDRRAVNGPQESRKDRLQYHSRSRSPGTDERHASRRRSFSSRDHNQPSIHALASADPSSSDIDHRQSRRQKPPRSPAGRTGREQGFRRTSPDPQYSVRSEVDDEMEPRASFRGGRNAEQHPKQLHDTESRGFSQSPPHGPSYHNSPSQSPRRGGRGGWNGKFSPKPSQYSRSGPHNPPNGPAAHYQRRSPPHGPSRGGPRGGNRGAGFRSSSFRGQSYRNDNPKNSHREGLSHDHPAQGELDGSRQNPLDEERPVNGGMDLDEEVLEAPNDVQSVEPSQQEREDDSRDESANRLPPSGPSGQGGGSGKFSFAFKPSSKPAPAAPKPEISQKFNATPKRRQSPERPRVDREPPPSAPRQPAAARSRPDVKNAPEGPRMAPRMRKVKKVLRRLKSRPTLPPDLATSESVFFRKPGNESVVGSGTYGKVFKGLNVYTKGLVALKRIRMEGERDGFPVTAVREIKLLQSLRHTNIVRLQEVMVEKNDCFMVFEYLSHDLTGLLNHPSFKLDPAQKKHLAQQLFEGLDYLHMRGVLHRDIKAANILVSNEGILKLADFGLARFYAKRHQLDYTNRVITIWYRSPELLLGETKYTAAVDVWSAACVMIEIFSRHAIFAGDGTELSQLEKIYNVLGTPNLQDWPGLVDLAWFELLRPTAKRRNVFAEKYQHKVTPAAFDLLTAMFQYDPTKRPTAAQVLQHAYFTTEEPLPKQAVELSNIDGDWHEFESKALRKENERREREARKAGKDAGRDKDKKRPTEQHDQGREAKRIHVDKSVKAEGGHEPPSGENEK